MILLDMFRLESLGPGIWVLLGLFIIIGVAAQWMLYVKCNQPGISCIIPIWNFVTFMKIIGRPSWHWILAFIPIYNIYFTIKVYVELCNCFGRNKTSDYVLIILFNGFYVFHLGLSQEAKYLGAEHGYPAGS